MNNYPNNEIKTTSLYFSWYLGYVFWQLRKSLIECRWMKEKNISSNLESVCADHKNLLPWLFLNFCTNGFFLLCVVFYMVRVLFNICWLAFFAIWYSIINHICFMAFSPLFLLVDHEHTKLISVFRSSFYFLTNIILLYNHIMHLLAFWENIYYIIMTHLDMIKKDGGKFHEYFGQEISVTEYFPPVSSTDDMG